MVLSASCLLSCTLDAEDSGEPTASVSQGEGILFSMPGVGGLNVLWGGPGSAANGTELVVGDVAPDGISVDTGSIGRIATGKLTAQGPEIESLVGYGDFNGDGQTDLLFRTQLGGILSIWIMEGHRVKNKIVSSNNAVPVFFSGPAKGYVGDVNGDGISDIVWTGSITSSTYRTLTWFMPANSIAPASTTTFDSTTTETIAVANFNGDLTVGPRGDFLGHADYLMRATRGDGMVKLKNGATGAETPIAPVLASSGWVVKAVGDFNADRYADALWHRATEGEVSIWEGRANGVMVPQAVLASVPASSGWTLAGTADVDSEVIGRTDIIWQHKARRVTSIWRMIDSTHVNFENERPFVRDSIVGIMNMTRPVAPTDLMFSRPSNGETTITVRNNSDVLGTQQMHVRNQTGGAVVSWNASLGKITQNAPASTLAGGANACLVANVGYHGRFSNNSPVVCGSFN